MQPFSARRLHSLPRLHHEGWDLKHYAVVYGDLPFDSSRFDEALPAALQQLPTPARTAERAGVGFLIRHQGRGFDYLVLAWWDRENELPLRVFVREALDGAWHPARDRQSICVWDLELIWAERQAYVQTILADGDTAERASYLDRDAVASH